MSMLKKMYPALVLSIICLCCGLLLATTYALTKGRIAEQQDQSALMQKQSIFPQSELFVPIEINTKDYAAMESGGFAPEEVYEVRDAMGHVIGYIVISDAFGYAGNITVMVGFLSDGHIVRVTASAEDETPNLGQDVENKSFLSQFEQIQPFHIASTANDSNTVDLLSGATLSSQATVDAFNTAVKAFTYLTEEGVL